MTTLASHRRILAASLVGTAVEFFDFYIYATAAALVFGAALLSRRGRPAVQLLSGFRYASSGVHRAAVRRDVFGHFGDRVGRKSTLVASLVIMGLSTVDRLSPHLCEGGLEGPGALCMMRRGQGLRVGGEWGGAALLAVETPTRPPTPAC